MAFISNRQLVEQPRSILEKVHHRWLYWEARRRFNESRSITIKPLGALFPSLETTRLALLGQSFVLPPDPANLTHYEITALAIVCARLNPHLVFEFGTYNGLTTLHLAMNSPQDTRILTLDLHPNDPLSGGTTEDGVYDRGMPIGAYFLGTREASKIDQIFCNSLEFNHSALSGRVDLVFVDGGHQLDIVESDSEKALAMLSPEGIIFWHDYSPGHFGVYSFLNRLAKSATLYQIANTALVCHCPKW